MKIGVWRGAERTIGVGSKCPVSAAEKEVEEDGEDDAHDQHGDDGEVEATGFEFDTDIAGWGTSDWIATERVSVGKAAGRAERPE